MEYCLLEGVNDSEACAHLLGELLQPRSGDVFLNLIPFNPVPGLPYRAPAIEACLRFGAVVMGHGVRAHVRRQLGATVGAACGQLAKIDGTYPGATGDIGLDIEDACRGYGGAPTERWEAPEASGPPRPAPSECCPDDVSGARAWRPTCAGYWALSGLLGVLLAAAWRAAAARRRLPA